LRLRLLERDAIIPVIYPRDDIAGTDMLVVGNRDRGDVAGYFRSERGLPCRDESVIGGLKML